MKEFPKRQILINYLLDICTSDEQEEVEHWLNKEPGNVSLLQQVAKEMGGSESLSSGEKEHLKRGIFNRIDEKKVYPINQAEKNIESPKMVADTFYLKGIDLWLKVAAMILVIVTAGIVGSYYNHSASHQNSSEEIVFHQRTISEGQTATFRFGDGSEIKLNGGSTLRYPERFETDQREVYLKGEAFFSITRDTARPFTVNTSGSTIEVLGTKFNVMADSIADNVQVAVTEGKVALKSKGTTNAASALLTRNHVGVLNLSESQITIEKANAENYLSWIHKRLVFSGESLAQVSRQLEHLYNIDIEFEDKQLKQLQLTADIEKVDLEKVLSIISDTFDIRFTINGNKVIWMK